MKFSKYNISTISAIGKKVFQVWLDKNVFHKLNAKKNVVKERRAKEKAPKNGQIFWALTLPLPLKYRIIKKIELTHKKKKQLYMEKNGFL